jgi:integrase
VLQRLKGINKVSRRLRDGSVNIHYYHRHTGAKLEGEPGTTPFLLSWAAAEKAARDRLSGGTFSDLVRDFETSPEYEDLAESTRDEYTRKFQKIDAEWGTVPIAGLTDKSFRTDVLAWRDKIAKATRREADNLVAAIARVLSYGFDRGKLSVNVLVKVRSTYKSDRTDKIWLPEHVNAFMGSATLEMSRAMTLALHTGQRQGDLRRLPWTAYDGTRLTLRTSKSGGRKEISVRCTRDVKTMLDASPRTAKTILTTRTGIPWKPSNFDLNWREVCEAAALKAPTITDLNFHDLRGTAITRLAEAGCTIPEIVSITGHSLKTASKILEIYLSRTRELADSAIDKFEAKSKNSLQNND